MPKRTVKPTKVSSPIDKSELTQPVRLFIQIMTFHITEYINGDGSSSLLMYRILCSYTILDEREKQMVITYLRKCLEKESEGK